MRSIRLALAAALGLGGGVASAENWPEWRGPTAYRHLVRDRNRHAVDQDENIVWKAKLPGQGGSTPVVWEDRIFLTSADGDDLVVMGFDTKGTELWKTKVSSAIRTLGPGKGTPLAVALDRWQACLGLLRNRDLACLDRDGKIVWKFNVEERYGKIDIQFGMTSTPILHEGKLYLQLIHGTGAAITPSVRSSAWMPLRAKRSGRSIVSRIPRKSASTPTAPP